MRLQQVGLAFGLAALAGCTSTTSTGVVAMGPDMYGMKVVSRDLGSAAEKGLTDATVFCNGMGRQTQLLRTQITSDDYQLVFRCMGSAPVVVPQPANPVPSIAGMAIPNPNGPVLAGPAFIPPRTVPGVTAERLAMQARTPIFPVSPAVLANPAGPPSPPLPALGNTPVGPLMSGGRAVRPPSFATQPVAPPGYEGAGSAQPRFVPMAPLASPGLAPLASPGFAPLASPGFAPLAAPAPEAEAPRPGFFGRLFGSSEAPRARALPPVEPVSAPPMGGGMFPMNAAPAFSPAPARAPLPPMGSPLEPLRSPLAPVAAPVAAPAPLGAPPLFPPAEPMATPQPLAPMAPAGLAPVAAPPSRALPPVPLQPLPRLSTNVPSTLPPPSSTGGAAPTLPQPVSTEPPTTFWQTPRS